MASINYATREISCKIVYYGPGLSGKTTNLQIIHRKIPHDTKSEMVSLATETDRTLFFDFLPLDLGSIKGFATKFQLYTVPGQVYYNATRKLVLRGVDGVVFVADSQRDKMAENIESLRNLAENLKEYGIDLGVVPFVLQYNKRDLPGVATVEELDAQLNPHRVPTFEAQAHQGVGVFTTLKAIGKIVIDTFNAKYSARQSTRRPSVVDAPSTGASAGATTPPPPPPRPTAAPIPAPAAAAPPPPPARPAPVAPAPQYVAPAPPPAPAAMPSPLPPPPVPAPAPIPTILPPPPAPIPSIPVMAPPPPAPVPAPPAAPAPVAAPEIVIGFEPLGTPSPLPPPPVHQQVVFTDFPQGPAPTTTQQIPGLQSFQTGPVPGQVAPQPHFEAPTLGDAFLPSATPPSPASSPTAPLPGMPGFASSPSHVSSHAPTSQPPLPPAAPSKASATSTAKKGRLDGTLDPSDLDAEIARYERELAEQKAQEEQRRSHIQSNPGVNPNVENDPLASAFLTPEELGRLSGQDSYPTRRMPLGPGQP